MIKTYTFDTNVLSYYIKGDKKIKERLKDEIKEGNRFVINPITYYEINRGLLALNSRKKSKTFKKLCKIFGVVELTNSMLDIAAKHYVTLRKEGKLIEDADLFIAAICIENDMVLVTNNSKHFSRIGELKMENWVVE